MVKLTFKLIGYICNNSLTSTLLINNYANHVVINKRETDIKNKRICKTPFYKWYIKGYSNHTNFF
jgi:hypothetical protein